MRKVLEKNSDYWVTRSPMEKVLEEDIDYWVTRSPRETAIPEIKGRNLGLIHLNQSEPKLTNSP